MYLPAEVNKEIKPPGSGTIGERRTAVSSLLSPLQNKLQPPYSAAFTPGNAVDAGTLALSFTPSGVAPRLDLAYNVGAAIAPDYDWYRTLEGEEGSRTVTVRPSPYVVTTEAELIGLSNLAFGTAELNPEAAGTRTKDDFLGDTVYLGANIELKSPGWTPIGTSTNFFAGTFDGNYGGESSHSITGLFVSTNVIDAGLFGYTNGASIKNITVRGRVTSTANNAHIGGVVGYAVATAFENVVFGAEGDTSAVVYRPSASTAGYIGGIAGWAQCAVANSVVVFKNCVNYGEVTAVTSNASYAGGIVSMMNTSSPEGTLVFDGCQNYGDVAATATAANQAAYAAGLVYQNSKGTLVLLDCQNYGDVAVDVAVNSAAATATASGLVGFGQIQKQFAYGGADYDCSLYIKNCENHGNIESTLNVAGAAWQLWAVSRIDGFTNYGDITVRTKAAAGTAVSPVAAGVFGYVNANVTDVTINNCTNNGAVRADVSASTSISTGVRAGGIGGYTETLYSERYLTMTGCVNNGGVTVVGPKANMSAANYVGGLLGQVALSSNFSGRVTFERCGNTEDITVVADPAATLRSYAAGILAYLQYNGANPVRVTGCSNTGDISSPGELPASGIVNVYGSGNILKISASFSTGAVTGDAPYGVSNVTSQAMVDTCYYVPGAAGGDKTAKAWSGGFDSMEFAGRLNRAAGCADIWAKGDPVPVHADGDNAIRNLMLAWSSVDKNGEPSTASNTVSVTGNREIGSDGVIYASKNASLTMVFNTAPNYILQLLTLKDGGGAELLADSNLTSMPFALGAPAVTATALFAAKDPALTPPFTVGFDLGGAPGPVPDAQSVDGYGKAVEPTPPVWADYLFLGWYTPDGSKWHFAGAVMRPMTLTARWHDGFRVIFDYNYDVGPAPDTQLVRYGEAVTPPADPTRPILNEGNYDEVRYKFQGWSTQATGGDKWDFSTVVAKGDPRLVPADPIPQLTLYAQWEEIQGEYAFEVIFYPNYPGATTTSDKFGFDTAVTRPANPVRPPVMAGDEILTEYEFLGWFPYVGAGSNSVFKPQFDFETIITEENINNYSTYGYSGVIELYAQWEATSRLPDAATIEIDSAEILPAVAEMVDGGIGFEGKTLILTQDITIDGNVWNPTLGGTIPMDLATGFRGTLTAVPGVTLTLENLRRPLFLKIGAAGTVDGLTITGSYTSLPSERIMSSRGSLQSGGITSEHGLLAAYNEGTITNCVLQNARITMIDPVTTTAVYDVGGLVGKNSGTIADCSAENCEIELILETTFVDFSGGSNDDKISAGTLVGYSTKPLVNLAVTGGSVIATDIGVPMNSNLSDIFGGYTAGFMSQTEWYAIGGIAGKSAGGENCVNDGCEVNGGFIAGGVFGTQPYDTPETGNIISGCENSGTVKGYLGAGGVVGFVNYETVVSRCKNTGEIGNTQAGQTFIQGAFGGVVGLATFTVVIENCVNGEQGQKITVPNQIYNYGGILGGGVRARDNLTRVTGCTNYASFIEAEEDGDYFQGNIGGLVGGGAALVEKCVNRGDIILPHAVMTGGLGGGEAQFLYTDQIYYYSGGEPGSIIGTWNGVAYIDPPSFRDCVFYGKLETADGNGGGVLVGGPGYMIEGCLWLDTAGSGTADRKLTGRIVTGMARYGGSTGLIKGIRDGYYAVSGLETGADRREAAFVPWSMVESGELAWLLDGGEGAHRNFWTQKDGVPAPGEPSVYRLEVSIEAEREETVNETVYLPLNETYTIAAERPDSVVQEGNKIIRTIYTPVLSADNCTLNGAQATLLGNGSVSVTYEIEIREETISPEPKASKAPKAPEVPEVPTEPEPPSTDTGTGDGAGEGDGTGGTGSEAGGNTGAGQTHSNAPAENQQLEDQKPQVDILEEPEFEEPQAPVETQDEELKVNTDIENVSRQNNLPVILLICGAVALAVVVPAAAALRRKKANGKIRRDL